MKCFLIVILAVCLLLVTSVYSQVTTGSNIATGATQYVGWGSGSSKDLDIQNNFGNKNIILWTNDSSSTTQRMTIVGNTGNVGINLSTPLYKLDVYDSTGSNVTVTKTGNFVAANPNAQLQSGLWGESRNNDTGTNIGVFGVALGTADTGDIDMTNKGVYGQAKGSLNANIGVFGAANDTPTITMYALKNEGVHANASGSPYENRAGTFITEGDNGINYSVWARSTHGDADDSVWGGAPNNYAGYFLGDMFISGCIINQCGDFMKKDTSIHDIVNALDTLSKLKPKSFLYFKDSLIGLKAGRQYGFIPDSVGAFHRIIREVYQATDINDIPVIDTFKSFTYTELIPLLVAGVNELTDRTDSLGLGYWSHVGSNLTARDTTWNVGIGTTSPIARLHVFNDTLERGAFISTIRSTPDEYNCGIYANAEGSELGNVGGTFVSQGPTNRNNIGIIAAGKSSSLFIGSGVMFGTLAEISDEELKDSIEDVSGALNVLSQLQPKTFVFKRDSFPYLNLPEGQQLGLIAQQADSIVPSLVQNTIIPEVKDANDSVIIPVDTFKSLNYTELIPLLISGINELNDKTITTDTTPTDSNYVTKWSGTSGVLTKSNIYDNGTQVGIGTTLLDSIVRLSVVGNGMQFGMFAVGDTAGGKFEGGKAGVYAIGDAIGGNFEGGTAGVYAIGDTVGGYFEGETGGIYASGDTFGGVFHGTGFGAYGLSDGSNEVQYGVYGESKNAEKVNAGVYGIAETPADSAINIGLWGVGQNSEHGNAGVAGIADSENDTALNVGVAGYATKSGKENHAGDFSVKDTIGKNYGILAKVGGADTINDYAAYLDGKVVYTGDLCSESDRKLKQNIDDLENSLDILKQLNPKRYEFKREQYPAMSLPKGTHYGLIADEVEQVLPDLVSTIYHPEYRDIRGNVISRGMEYKGINYPGLIPFLLQGIKEQQAIIDSMKARLTALETKSGVQYRMSDDGTGMNPEDSVNHLTVELSSMQVVVLDQNVPNPFAEQTTISYFIPEDAGAAKIMFFDMSGRMLKSVDVEKGSGIITVFAPNLSSGTYSYSLLIDGKTVETKKMVKMR